MIRLRSHLIPSNYCQRGEGEGVTLNSAELYDPSIEIWITITDVNDARQSHTASLSTNERLLIVSRDDNDEALQRAEIY